MGINNNNGGGVEYEVEPSSGPQARSALLISAPATLMGGLLLCLVCLGPGGDLWVIVGLLLLVVSFVFQLVALRRLRPTGPLADLKGEELKTRFAAVERLSGSGKTPIAAGFADNSVPFAGAGEEVVFCRKQDDGSYVELARSVPIVHTTADVTLHESHGSYWVTTVQPFP